MRRSSESTTSVVRVFPDDGAGDRGRNQVLFSNRLGGI